MKNKDQWFISEAYLVARQSKDPSTQVGACIVSPDNVIISKAYNGPCRGENDDDPTLYQRPLKNFAMAHAEENAVFNCARQGVSSLGCTMYGTFGPCCHNCARAIVQSGIKEFVYHAEFPAADGWAESLNQGYETLTRCGVKIRAWSGLPDLAGILSSGKIVTFESIFENGSNFIRAIR